MLEPPIAVLCLLRTFQLIWVEERWGYESLPNGKGEIIQWRRPLFLETDLWTMSNVKESNHQEWFSSSSLRMGLEMQRDLTFPSDRRKTHRKGGRGRDPQLPHLVKSPSPGYAACWMWMTGLYASNRHRRPDAHASRWFPSRNKNHLEVETSLGLLLWCGAFPCGNRSLRVRRELSPASLQPLSPHKGLQKEAACSVAACFSCRHEREIIGFETQAFPDSV